MVTSRLVPLYISHTVLYNYANNMKTSADASDQSWQQCTCESDCDMTTELDLLMREVTALFSCC